MSSSAQPADDTQTAPSWAKEAAMEEDARNTDTTADTSVALTPEQIAKAQEDYADIVARSEEVHTMQQTFERWTSADFYVPMEAPSGLDAETREHVTAELNAKKFLLQLAARSGMPGNVIQRLDAARCDADLAFCRAAAEGTRLRVVWDLTSRAKSCLAIIAQQDAAVSAVVELAIKEGRTLALKDGEVTDNFISPEAVERLKKEHNVGVATPYPMDGKANLYLDELKKRADQSHRMVEAGMPVVGTEDLSDKGALARLNEAIVTASIDATAYKNALCLQTRADGDLTLGIGFDLNDYYSKLEPGSFSDWRTSPLFSSTQLAVFYTHLSASSDFDVSSRSGESWIEQFAGTPMIDCPVFVSCLFMLLKGRFVGRVSSASDVLRTYIAALIAISAKREADHEEKQAAAAKKLTLNARQKRSFARQQRKLRKAAKESGISEKDIGIGVERSISNCAWSTPDEAADFGSQLRESDLGEWEEAMQVQVEYYRKQRDARDSPDRVVGQRAAFEAPEMVGVDGGLASEEEAYFQRMLVTNEQLVVAILRTYEIQILVQLREFFPLATREQFMTPADIPTPISVPQLITDRIVKTNRAVAVHRAQLVTDYHVNGVMRSLYDENCLPYADEDRTTFFRASLASDPMPNAAEVDATDNTPQLNVPPPPLPVAILDSPIFSDRPYSPDLRTMRAMHCHMLTLNCMTEERTARLDRLDVDSLRTLDTDAPPPPQAPEVSKIIED